MAFLLRWTGSFLLQTSELPRFTIANPSPLSPDRFQGKSCCPSFRTARISTDHALNQLPTTGSLRTRQPFSLSRMCFDRRSTQVGLARSNCLRRSHLSRLVQFGRPPGSLSAYCLPIAPSFRRTCGLLQRNDFFSILWTTSTCITLAFPFPFPWFYCVSPPNSHFARALPR